jgi:glycosyltransferase involved in cell wall biosynthesis
MHILIVSEHFHKRPSGPRTAILGLTSALVELGHQLSLVGIAPRNMDETLPGGGEARMRRYWWKVVPVRHGRHRFYARQMLKVHRSRPVDAVIAMGVLSATVADHFRTRTGTPWILNPRSGLSHAKGTPKYDLAKEMMQRSGALVAAGKAHVKLWCNALDVIPGPKHFAAFNGWDPTRLDGDAERPDSVPPDVPGDAPLILCMGMLRKVKGQGLLLRALATINDRPWHLVLGGDGPERASFEQLCADLGLAGRVTFAGMVQGPHWRWLYRNADIFCLYPTYNEAFGNVFVESQGAGLPVVSSSNGAIPEIVLHEQTGLIVPWHPDAPEQTVSGLADALARLIDDEGLRLKLGQAAKARASEFTWQASARQYLNAIEYARRQ